MSADTYKKYEQSYKQYKKTGKYGDTSWMKQDEVDLFNNIRQGKGRSAKSGNTYYYMDNDTYDKYGRSRASWKATGDYGDTSWMNQNDVDAFNAIRGSRSKQDNDFDDFRYSLNDDIIKSVQDKYRSQWGDKYYYDITDMDDVARMNAGQMPKYLAQKYKDDPYDRWLYENNLPSTKDFNDMYSQAVLDYNEQQQKRSGQLQNIINGLNDFDNQRAAFLQGRATGKSAEDLLATGDYDTFNAYYQEAKKAEENPYKARQNAAATDYSAYDKVFDALYSSDPNALNEALTDDFWDKYSDKDWQKYLNQKLAWNEGDNDRQIQIAADQQKRAWNKAKSDYDKQVEKARADYVASLPIEEQAAYQRAAEAEQAAPEYQAVTDRLDELRKEIRKQQHYVKDLGHDPAKLNAAQTEYNNLQARKNELEQALKSEEQIARENQAALTKQLHQIDAEIARISASGWTVDSDRMQGLIAQRRDINEQLHAQNEEINERDRAKATKQLETVDADMSTEDIEAELVDLNIKLAGYRQTDGTYRETEENKDLIARHKELESKLTLIDTAGRSLQNVNNFLAENGGSDEIADSSSWSSKARHNYKVLSGQVKTGGKLLKLATPEEIAGANAAAAQGEEAFNAYFKDLETVLKYRSTLERSEKFEEMAQQDAVGASVLSVGMGVLSAAEGAGNILSSLNTGYGNAVDMVYAGYMTSASQAIRNTVSEDIILNNSDQSILPNVSTGQIYSFLYQSGMSMLDSAARIPLGTAGLAIAGLSAADSTILEQLENGATTRQAVALGVVAGFAEFITEKVSLEQLLTAKTSGTLKQFLWETAKQAITEGSEEIASEVINIIAEAIILEDNDFTWPGIRDRIIEAGLGGFVSGLGFGAIGQTVRTSRAGGFANVRTAQSIAADILGQNGFDSATGKAGEIGKFRAEYTKAVMKAGLSEEARTNCLNLMDQMAADAGFLATPEGYKLAEHLKGIVESESSRAQVRVKNFEAEEARNRQRLSKMFSNLQNLAEQARSMVNDPQGHSQLYREFMEASQEYQEAQQAEQNRQEAAEIKLQEAERQTEQKVADAVEKAANDYTQLTAALSEARGADALAALGDQLAKAEAVENVSRDAINEAESTAIANGDEVTYNLLEDLVRIQRTGDEQSMAQFADDHADLMDMLVNNGAESRAEGAEGATAQTGTEAPGSANRAFANAGNNIQEEMVNANSNGRNGQSAEGTGRAGDLSVYLNGERGTGGQAQQANQGSGNEVAEVSEPGGVREKVWSAPELEQKRVLKPWTEKTGKAAGYIEAEYAKKGVAMKVRRVESVPSNYGKVFSGALALLGVRDGITLYTQTEKDPPSLRINGINHDGEILVRFTGNVVKDLMTLYHEIAHSRPMVRALVKTALGNDFKSVLDKYIETAPKSQKDYTRSKMEVECLCDIFGLFGDHQNFGAEAIGNEFIDARQLQRVFDYMNNAMSDTAFAEDNEGVRQLGADEQYSLDSREKTTDTTIEFDGEDYPSTSLVYSDAEAYSDYMQSTIKGYLSSVDPEVSEFAYSVLTNDPNAKSYLPFKPVSDELASDINKILGINTHGWGMELVRKAIEHNKNRHDLGGFGSISSSKRVKLHDHSMRNLNDFARVQYVIDHYDKIEYGGIQSSFAEPAENGGSQKAESVILSKKIDGTFYVVEAVPRTNAHRLEVIGAYISNKGAQLSRDTQKSVPRFTANTAAVSTPILSISKDRENEYTQNKNAAPVSNISRTNKESAQSAFSDDNKLTPREIRQLDANYLHAIERGNFKIAEQYIAAVAKQAMPNSRILDGDGNLLVVYHGTDQEFRSFDMSKGRSTMDIQGAFFSPWELDASGYGPNVGKYYLNITNPAPEGVAYSALNRFKGQNEAGRKAREFLISKGYDGVNNGDEEYIAFYPSQIKSADPITYDEQGNPISLSQRFNEEEDDFNFASREIGQDADQATDELSSEEQLNDSYDIAGQNDYTREVHGPVTNNFNLDSYSEEEARNIIRDQRNYFGSTEAAIEKFIRENIPNKPGEYKRLYCGKIGDTVANRIYQDIGIDLAGVNLIIDASFENAHADPSKEEPRGQTAITPDIVAKIPAAINNYVSVYDDGQTKDGRRGIIFELDIDGKKIAIEYYSSGRKALSLKTVYGWAKETRSLPVTMNAGNPAPITTPEVATASTSLLNNIRGTEPDVNSGEEPSDLSSRDIAGTTTKRSQEVAQQASALYNEGVSLTDYFNSGNYDNAVAAQLRGLMLRNGQRVGGKLSEQEVGKIIADAGNWKKGNLYAFKAPVRIFQKIGQWHDTKTKNAAAYSKAVALNMQADEYYSDTYYSYMQNQLAAENTFKAGVLDKIHALNPTEQDAILAQLIGEKVITPEMAQRAVMDKKHILIPIGSGAMVLDRKGRVRYMADSNSLFLYSDDVLKKAAERARKINEIRNDNEGSKDERIKALQSEGDRPVERLGVYSLRQDGNHYSIVDQSGNAVFEMDGESAYSDTANELAETLSAIYGSMYDSVQSTLVENGYAPIGRIENYFPHFTQAREGVAGMIDYLKSEDLPTEIAGLTPDFSPGKPWARNLLSRMGDKTDYNAVRGFEQYLNGVSDVIYMTPVIQRFRQLESALRTGMASKTAERQDVNAANTNFLRWLHDYTNQLANKKPMVDRGVEETFGRKVYTLPTKISGFIGTSYIGGNIRTALTNLASFAQGTGQLGPKWIGKGLFNTATTDQTEFGDDFRNKCSFLINRQSQAEEVALNMGDKFRQKGEKILFGLMEAVDNFSTETIARAKYYQLTQEEGLDSDEALKEVSKWCVKLFAERSKGSRPTVFNSKVMSPITQFQIEPFNQMWHWSDIHNENVRSEYRRILKENNGVLDGIDWGKVENQVNRLGVGRKDLAQILGRLIALSVYGVIMRALTGSDATWNPAGIIGDMVNGAKKEGASGAIDAAKENVMDNIPFASLVEMIGSAVGLGGDDFGSTTSIPIPALSAVNTAVSAIKGGTPESYMEGATYFLPGGGQLRKTAKGIGAYVRGGSYNGKGKLRYPIEQNAGNAIRAAVFGASAVKPKGYEFGNTLNDTKTAAYQQAVENGIDQNDAYDFLVNYQSDTKAYAIASLATSDLDDNGMRLMADILGIEIQPGNIKQQASQTIQDQIKSVQKKYDSGKISQKTYEQRMADYEAFMDELVG